MKEYLKSFVAGIGWSAALVMGATITADAKGARAAELSRDQMRAALEAAGYSAIHDLERDDGAWEADVTDSTGHRVEVVVDAQSGEVVSGSEPPIIRSSASSAKVQPDQIRKSLESRGYTKVRDVEWDEDGYWEVDATSPAGIDVDLHIDPESGDIVREMES